jgi:RNA-binding protein YlmH
MENNDILRRARDLAERCGRSGTVTQTTFLTPAEQYAVERAFSAGEERPLFSGGNGECERRCAFFLPYYLAAEDFDPAEYIRCVAFQSFFGAPGHRDYLGAVLALGIGRERIGDIRIREDRAWIFCLPGVEPLLLGLDRAGRYAVRAAECPLTEVPEEEHRVESVTFTVQSLRLDAVTGGIFRMSRSAAAEQIRLGLVSLNYAVCDKADAPVREGDVISLRGKGKGQVREIGGRSKKDRLFITAERRL